MDETKFLKVFQNMAYQSLAVSRKCCHTI